MKKESIFIYVSLSFTYTHISKWVERKGGFMDNFAFYSPTYFAFGKGEEMKAGSLVKRFGGSKVLIHFGGGSGKVYGFTTLSEEDVVNIYKLML